MKERRGPEQRQLGRGATVETDLDSSRITVQCSAAERARVVELLVGLPGGHLADDSGPLPQLLVRGEAGTPRSTIRKMTALVGRSVKAALAAHGVVVNR